MSKLQISITKRSRGITSLISMSMLVFAIQWKVRSPYVSRPKRVEIRRRTWKPHPASPSRSLVPPLRFPPMETSCEHQANPVWISAKLISHLASYLYHGLHSGPSPCPRNQSFLKKESERFKDDLASRTASSKANTRIALCH